MCICFTSCHLKPTLKGSYCTTAIKDIKLAVSESCLDAQTYNVHRADWIGHIYSTFTAQRIDATNLKSTRNNIHFVVVASRASCINIDVFISIYRLWKA